MLELPTSLVEALKAGATIVVPSRQRATALRLAHAAAQLRLGRKAWGSPDIVSWGTWLEREAARAVESGASLPRVLRAAEEWLAWREAVRTATRDSELAASEALVDSIRRAGQLLHDWRIPPAALLRAPSRESDLLSMSLQSFEAQCAKLRATASVRLPELLQGSRPTRPVAFAGFTETTRARRALMDRWAADGASLREHTFNSSRGETSIACAEDPAEELALAAAWCRQHLAEDPQRRLLVVVPDLAQRRQAIVRAFEQVLAPHRLMGADTAEAGAGFAIEGGQPLASYPLVRHALESLRLLTGKLDFTALSGWLRASFWKVPEATERARLELWLRAHLRPESDSAGLRETLDRAPHGVEHAARAVRAVIDRAAHALSPNVHSLQQAPAASGQRRSAPPARQKSVPSGQQQLWLPMQQRPQLPSQQWAPRIAAALAALGWPGPRSLTSAEHQTRTRFLELLNELAELGTSLGRLDAVEAIRVLQDLAARTTFEPATGDAAVTLTDAVADPVVRYDGVWVSGLHADVWPRPFHFDPFIPLALQRKAGIPATSAVGLLRQARALADVWQRSTPQLVLSWPRRGDDCEYLASPLLGELADARPLQARERHPALARAARGTAALESFEDIAGEPWPADAALPAGTRSIEYQSRCPFRAYAELRLDCLPMDAPRHGVDARERGHLLHRALQLVWTRLEDWHGLKAHDTARLEQLVEECVDHALKDCFSATVLREQARALARERRRAQRLVLELCELERRRQPFRVRALEARREVSFSGAALDVRIDRIDDLEDGSAVIFDYKTGKPQAVDWLGERISSPQLLVYLHTLQTPISALVNAYLTSARVSYRGMADQKGRLPGVDALKLNPGARPDLAWHEQLDRWRRHIEDLARDFLAGRAVVDPVEQACRTCHLHTFCRIADNNRLSSDRLPESAAGDE